MCGTKVLDWIRRSANIAARLLDTFGVFFFVSVKLHHFNSIPFQFSYFFLKLHDKLPILVSRLLNCVLLHVNYLNIDEEVDNNPGRRKGTSD